MKKTLNIKKKALIFISRGLDEKKFSFLKKKFPKIIFKKYFENNKSSLNKNIKDINILINCPRYIFNNNLIKEAKNLEWIHQGGAGIEEFMIEELKQSKITLTNGKIIQGPEVADHALALLLFLTRNLNSAQKNFNDRRPVELYGKNAFVFGLGGIGLNICERLNSFGSLVYGYTNDNIPLQSYIKKIYYNNDYKKILKNMDIIICAMPNTFRTKNFFNKNFFTKIKKGSYFINISRGDLVNTNDLTEYIKNETIIGAGLDVTTPEPLNKNHPLKKFENVIITPHIAGQSDNNRERSFELLCENIRRYLYSEKLLNIVSKKEEY